MHIEKQIYPGDYLVNVENMENGEIVYEIAEGEHKGEKIIISPIGITKKNRAESKRRQKIAKKSRRINRKR
jgi:hypothetical protein